MMIPQNENTLHGHGFHDHDPDRDCAVAWISILISATLILGLLALHLGA